MRKLLIFLLRKPILWIDNKFSSKPDKEKIYQALTNLYNHIVENAGEKGLEINFDLEKDKFIIFSDQHKGRRNGADDFAASEQNYLSALQYYEQELFTFINLGDGEELWENVPFQIIKPNREVFEAEKKFLHRNAFVKIFGNHDLYWSYGTLANLDIEKIFGEQISIYEGIILRTNIQGQTLSIFCTHGHQGDARSDGNKLSKFFVANIWAPLQSYLRINPNEPSNSIYKKTIHNEIMYEWSATQKNKVLITGHTHQPVFESLTYIEKLFRNMQRAKYAHDDDLYASLDKETKALDRDFAHVTTDFLQISPSYFNTGCCCFADGDITGIEIEKGYIRLIKWEKKTGEACVRIVLEEKKLETLIDSSTPPPTTTA